MPELPEVETTRRGLAACIEGRRLAGVAARRPDLRFPLPPDFARRMEGRVAERLDRRAKYILVRLEGGLTWLIHLGMSGRLIVGAGPLPPLGRHDHVTVETDAAQEQWVSDMMNDACGGRGIEVLDRRAALLRENDDSGAHPTELKETLADQLLERMKGFFSSLRISLKR